MNSGQREAPRHRVYLDAFYIDRYEVTNALFERFVQATNHLTRAERDGKSWDWQQREGVWHWTEVAGATWRQPSGPRRGQETRKIGPSRRFGVVAAGCPTLDSRPSWEG